MPMGIRKPNKKGSQRPIAQSLLRHLKERLSNGFPNPKRIGCPQIKALKQNARNPASADEAVSKHVGSCSPCYRLYSRLLRKEIARMRSSDPRKKRPRLRNSWTEFTKKTPLCK